MREPIVGQTVRRVVYYNLPNAAWDRFAGLHVTDFGLDLEFDDSILGVTWDVPTQAI